jgi:type III secretory pathway component EscR
MYIETSVESNLAGYSLAVLVSVYIFSPIVAKAKLATINKAGCNTISFIDSIVDSIIKCIVDNKYNYTHLIYTLLSELKALIVLFKEFIGKRTNISADGGIEPGERENYPNNTIFCPNVSHQV